MQIWQKKIENFKIQDSGQTLYWKSFLAISRRHIDLLLQNLDQKYRSTYHQYRTHDQNCNFRTFKMADGRHFENSFICISQPWIIRFLSNLVHRYKLPFRAWKFHKKKSKLFKFKMADGCHIENRFLAINLGALLADQRKIRKRDEESHVNTRHVTKTTIFQSSWWRTAAVLKIALSPYLRRELSDSNQIWNTGANFHSDHGKLTKIRYFSNWRWRTDAILKIVFWLYLGTILADLMQISEWTWRITWRYRSRDQNGNFRKCKMPPFWK